jgi:hypothetical protein
MRTIHYFHIMCDGKTLREYDKETFFRMLKDERLQLGYIDEDQFYLLKPGISKDMLLRILKLGGWIQ